MPWRRAFLAAAAAALALGPVRFGFSATTGDWLRHLPGNAALVILTLGAGALLLPFRQWRFWADRLALSGERDSGTVRQSQLQAPGHGEGLAEVLDIGGV